MTTKGKLLTLVSAVLVAGTALGGCSGVHTRNGMAMGSQAGMSQGDPNLDSAVMSALTRGMGAEAKDITVANNGGRVTLSGWVDNPESLSKALAIAKRVPGVSRSYSQIHTWSSGPDN